MFLLITGASGMGKTTVRKIVAPQLVDKLESAELNSVSDNPFVRLITHPGRDVTCNVRTRF